MDTNNTNLMLRSEPRL